MTDAQSGSNTRREKGMKMHLRKAVIGSAVGVVVMANIAVAGNVAVGVDVNTPNVRVKVGSAPAPRPVTVVEKERVVVVEKEGKHDNGKHKGQHKKHKKHKD